MYACYAERTRAFKAGTSRLQNLAKVDGEVQPVAAQISQMDTPLDQAQDEAMPLVEWALTPIGHCRPKEECASEIATTIHLDGLCFMTGSLQRVVPTA